MPEPAISYVARPDATPEIEINALANIYRFIVDRRVKQDALGVGNTEGDDAKERFEDVYSATQNYTR